MDLTIAQLRDEFARTRRLGLIAAEWHFSAHEVAPLLQPFIDRYKNLRLARRPHAAPLASPHPHAHLIAAAVRRAADDLRRRGIKGLPFHNGLQHAIAQLADHFGCRGFTECAACYTTNDGLETAGRIDVVWATQRTPTVLFEVDSTPKPASLAKLRLAEANHKFWVYFGPNLWTFRALLKQADPTAEVLPILIPPGFVPRREPIASPVVQSPHDNPPPPTL